MQLNEFLVKAKINTYASSGESGEKDLDDGSKELIYEEGDWKYRDRYFGFNPFIGQEIVWRYGEVIWGMNYHGNVLSDAVSASKIYAFLKRALSRVEETTPFRGSRALDEGDFGYRNSSSGSVDEFQGVEIILYQGKRVYELKYNGGIVKK